MRRPEESFIIIKEKIIIVRSAFNVDVKDISVYFFLLFFTRAASLSIFIFIFISISASAGLLVALSIFLENPGI